MVYLVRLFCNNQNLLFSNEYSELFRKIDQYSISRIAQWWSWSQLINELQPKDKYNECFVPGSLSNSSGDLDAGGLGTGTSHIKSGHKVTSDSLGSGRMFRILRRDLSLFDNKPISSFLWSQQVSYYPSKLAFAYLFPFCLSGVSRYYKLTKN